MFKILISPLCIFFNFSENKKSSKKVYDEMKVISKIFSQNKKALNLFSNPVVSIIKKKNLIFKFFVNLAFFFFIRFPY